MGSLITVLAVSLGGALGALSRVGISEAAGETDLGLTTLGATLAINTVGAALLGFVRRHETALPTALRLGVGVGFLGSFTTWSAVIVTSSLLTGTGQVALSVGYLLATLILGVGAARLALGSGETGRENR